MTTSKNNCHWCHISVSCFIECASDVRAKYLKISVVASDLIMPIGLFIEYTVVHLTMKAICVYVSSSKIYLLSVLYIFKELE